MGTTWVPGLSGLPTRLDSQYAKPMSQALDELISVMARLRAPGGCPWDREQTYASLAQYLLEEAYETFDAIQEADRTGDIANLREELQKQKVNRRSCLPCLDAVHMLAAV